MFADYHVHTAFSDDSVYPMENVIQDAIAMHMDEICFTEHVDYGIKFDQEPRKPILYRGDEPLTNCDYPLYFKTIEEMKKRYGHQITIKTGMEFGMQKHTIPQYQALFDRYSFDFILLSIHEIDDQEFWNQDYLKGKSQKEVYEGYYQALYELVSSYKNYSVLGHMDLINRYDKRGPYPFEKIKPWIQKVLEVVIRDQKGIEINTSSQRYGLKDSTPSKDILQLYYDLGGTILTIGSDSHKPEHLGCGIREAKAMLKEIGFQTYCTYEKMSPIFHRL